MESGSFLRCRNLTVGYNFMSESFKRVHIDKLRVYVQALNLFTITKYSGADPEMTVSDNAKGSGDLANGIDWGTYPAARSYNVGVNLTF